MNVAVMIDAWATFISPPLFFGSGSDFGVGCKNPWFIENDLQFETKYFHNNYPSVYIGVGYLVCYFPDTFSDLGELFFIEFNDQTIILRGLIYAHQGTRARTGTTEISQVCTSR